jgi:PKD repeat protein
VSINQDVAHTYAKIGTYTVTLEGWNSDCGSNGGDIKTKVGYIVVKPDISPILQLLLGD